MWDTPTREHSDDPSGLSPRRPIDLAHEPDIVIGPAKVRPSLRLVEGPQGERTLEPKMMKMLVALSREPGVLLSKDDMIERVWEGRIVGENSINRILSLLRSALRHSCGNAVAIETVPKVGYRLIYDGVEKRTGPAVGEEQRAEGDAWWKKPAVIVLAVIAFIAGAVGLYQAQQKDSLLEPLTIVMLPATNAPDVDPFFAAGMTGAIRDEISRQTALDISIAQSARQLAKSGRSNQDIGELLGADYVLGLNILSDGERVVVETQLLDALDGRSIWAETFRSDRDHAHQLPQRIRRSMMIALNRPYSDTRVEANITAADFGVYLVAMGKLQTRDQGDRGSAIPMLEGVVDRNPRFAAGMSALAKAYYLGRSASPEGRIKGREEARELALRALSIDDTDLDALKVAGKLAPEPAERISYLQRALALDPSDPEALYWLGIVQREVNAPADELAKTLEQLVAIDPLWPPSWNGPDGALMMGRRELASELEAGIIAAAARPAQAILARARLARLDGDLSGFLAGVEEARPSLTAAEFSYGASLQVSMVQFMLGLPYEQETDKPHHVLLHQVELGQPATRVQLAEALKDGDLFGDERLLLEQFRALTNAGRTDEIVGYFDARFSTLEDMAQWAREKGRANIFLPSIASDLAPALLAAGRGDQARELVAMAERALDDWDRDRGLLLQRLAIENRLAASRGQADRVEAVLGEMIILGWPYTVSHTPKRDLAPLIDDQLFEAMVAQPKIAAMLAPIRARIATERAEVLASSR